MIKIKWLGHACFKIYFDDIQCVIDPFEDNYVPGYRNIDTSADIILASHRHNDHYGMDSVRQLLRMVHGVEVKKVQTCHDEKGGSLRGENIVHVLEYNGTRIAHFGDIGHILTDEQVKEIGDIDVALIPIGGTYTVRADEARTICQQVKAKIIIPMHYRCGELGYEVLETTENFEKLFDNIEHRNTNEFILPDKITPNVVILQYRMEKEMTNTEILSRVDHTLLKADAKKEDILRICNEAVENNTASICINPSYIEYAVSVLGDRIPVCTVIGFPLGAMTTAAKVFEAKDAIAKGAKEVDMVINIAKAKDGDFAYIEDEIRQIKEAVGDHVLKVIIETCLLTDDEKMALCKAVVNAGADYIKTSTGFSTGGATFHDVELFAKYTEGKCKIKAAGGIRTRDDMVKFISLGADRLGTSSAIKILNSEKTDGGY
ncbi:MAG: deoxyribose-phosphate aldolase [Ruminococcaceae bacterium]|nr:deoxyribose-phosphate aldolase [Oscillospiraceae bacterium]